MNFNLDSAIFKGAYNIQNFMGGYLPFEFTGPKDEFMSCRTTASLGVFLNFTPVYDVYGPDVIKFMNYVCVNKDFSLLREGFSKHALICNDQGKMLADGVVIPVNENRFRVYWLAPVIQYFVESLDFDVKGEYINDEYFFQIDGPKSLEILEKACHCDLHDLKFAQNTKIQICGTDMVVHRLGMSGALAYEVHGAAKDAEIAYTKIREALEEFGGKLQGIRNYSMVTHTVGGYPNQRANFIYPLFTGDPGLADFSRKNGMFFCLAGSASDKEENIFVTPYDVGWGYLVNFDHDFMGKSALQKISQNPPNKTVTLEWNADDVADVFKSQFQGKDVQPYDPIEHHSNSSDVTAYQETDRADYVQVNGKNIGVATGKTYAYYEQKMVSLACIAKEYAKEGTDVIVLWGTPGHPQKEIRAKVVRFPYFNEEYRNETFDVNKIPRPYFNR
jgi:glycine cleavage system aminomethyltransferase T